MWRKFRDVNEESFGLDPAMFGDCFPKLEGEEMTPEHLDFFKLMG